MALAKRDAIIEAATALFSRYGVRRTSVEEIARVAGVAKPTVYAHFADKDALYAEVCTDVGQRIVASAEQAASTETPVEQRLAAVLAAKFTVTFELVEASPHAQELLSPQYSAARANIDRQDGRYRAVLHRAVTAAAERGEVDLIRLSLDLDELTDQLLQAGYGAGYGASTPQQHHDNLAALVTSLLRAGLPATPGRSPRLPTRGRGNM